MGYIYDAMTRAEGAQPRRRRRKAAAEPAPEPIPAGPAPAATVAEPVQADALADEPGKDEPMPIAGRQEPDPDLIKVTTSSTRVARSLAALELISRKRTELEQARAKNEPEPAEAAAPIDAPAVTHEAEAEAPAEAKAEASDDLSPRFDTVASASTPQAPEVQATSETVAAAPEAVAQAASEAGVEPAVAIEATKIEAEATPVATVESNAPSEAPAVVAGSAAKATESVAAVQATPAQVGAVEDAARHAEESAASPEMDPLEPIALQHFDPNGGAKLDDRLVSATDPLSIMAEEYRSIRTGILARWQQKKHIVHLITSATPQEGKTITSLNLGLSFAELRARRTIVVEADLRLPQFATLLGLPQGPGIIDVLEGKADLQKVITRLPGSGLHVIAAGGRAAAQAMQLLSTGLMASVIRRLRADFDHVIIDTPPVVQLADAGILGALSDDVMLVVRLGKTPSTLVDQAVRTLSNYNAPVAGVIATDDPHFRNRYHYRYDYRYIPKNRKSAA